MNANQPVEDTHSDLVERLARALCEAREINPNCLYQHHEWEEYPTDKEMASLNNQLEPTTITLHYAWRHRVKDAKAALAVMPAISTLQAENERLTSALERLDRNFKLLLARKPVRDVAETQAEVDHALSHTERGRRG